MPTTQMQPFHLFAPIERVNDEERTISAYAFVNEVVDGEGGVRLRRSAMEDATPDYMTWANVRRMHQPDAVGVTQDVLWDEKGAHLTLRVEDDDAWRKVKAGVYKGLSVGVIPKVMRGKDVTACKWYETSLVDRPKDPDAVITMFRAEGVDPEAAVEVEVLDEEAPAEVESTGPEITEDTHPAELLADDPEGVNDDTQRGEVLTLPADWTPEQVEEFRGEWERLTAQPHGEILTVLRAQTSDTVPERENLEGPKGDTHYDCGSEYGCHGHTTRGGAQECRERMAQGHEQQIAALEEHLAGMKAKRRAELGEPEPEPLPDLTTTPAADLLTRVETISADDFPTFATTILTRLETAESGLATERQGRLAAEERAEKLAKMPAARPPVRFPQALERTFQAHGLDPAAPDTTKLQAELKRVEEEGKAAAKAGDFRTAESCYFRLQELKTLMQTLSSGEE